MPTVKRTEKIITWKINIAEKKMLATFPIKILETKQMDNQIGFSVALLINFYNLMEQKQEQGGSALCPPTYCPALISMHKKQPNLYSSSPDTVLHLSLQVYIYHCSYQAIS